MTPNVADRFEAAANGLGSEAVSKINELKGKIQKIKFPFSHSIGDPAQQTAPTSYQQSMGVAPGAAVGFNDYRSSTATMQA